MNNYYFIVAATEETQGALYYDKKLSLTGTKPIGFEYAETLDMSVLGFNPTNDPEQEGLTTEQLTALVDANLEALWTGKLVIVSRPQGKWLHANHPAFMQEATNE